MSRIGLIAALLLCLSWFVTAQDTPVDLARQASTLYERADYAAALGVYEALLAAGIHDSTIYYNMGQAYYAMQDSGRALLQYRRAQQIAPRDVELNLALARVRAGRLDVQGDDAALIDSLAALTMPLLTFEELNWLAFGLWAACFGMIAAYVLRSQWRNGIRVLLFMFGILLLLGFGLWFSRVYTSVFRAAAVVTAEVAPIMSGPGENYLEIYQLHAAAELRMLEERGGWTHFVLPDGREGWIQVSNFEKV